MSCPAILLAEDDENDILLMQRAFKKAQVANPLHVVRNGEEVISYLTKMGAHERDVPQMPALLLLDLKMPKISGFEVLAWIRKHKPLNRMIVVALSSSREPADVGRCYDTFINSYIVKRTSTEEMVEMLKSLHNYWFGWNERPDFTVELVPRTGTPPEQAR